MEMFSASLALCEENPLVDSLPQKANNAERCNYWTKLGDAGSWDAKTLMWRRYFAEDALWESRKH